MSKADKKSKTEIKGEIKEEIAEENSLKFDFKKWVEETQLMEKTVHILLEQDLNVLDALTMLTDSDIKELNLTVGQQKLLIKGINAAKGSVPTNNKGEKVYAKEITTVSLSGDKDLEAILNKLESTGGLEALLTGAPLSTGDAKKAEISGGSHEFRVDSDPHVYLNRSKGLPKGSSKAIGTSKPLLIPDFVDYGADPYDEQEIASSNSTSVLVRTLKGKPKLESIAISTWIAAIYRTQ